MVGIWYFSHLTVTVKYNEPLTYLNLQYCREFLLTGCLGGISFPRLDDAFIDLSIENSGCLSTRTVFLRKDVNIR